MSWRIATVACLATAACGGARTTTADGSPSEDRDGVYEFSASIPSRQAGSTIRVQGTLTVVGDSLFVQSPNGCSAVAGGDPSVPSGLPSGPTVHGFYCGGAWLSFDRNDPLKSAKWFTTVPIPRQRNICVEEVVREAARRVCVRWRPETYYTYERRSGGIQVRRI